MATVGVLALQGAFALHRPHIEALGADYREVVSLSDLAAVDALILPGGESATMLKLLWIVGMHEHLRRFSTEKPTWGICAGAILLASQVRNPEQTSLESIDVVVERNSYGRQLDSFEEEIRGYRVAYIRAPRILSVGQQVEVLARNGNDPVWVESRRVILTTFHPETNSGTPSPWHRRLLALV